VELGRIHEQLHGHDRRAAVGDVAQPFLKIFVTIGYYDMATVMGGAEYNFAHLGYDPTFVDRVSFTYYEAGHMIYIRPSEHKKLKDDIAKFIQATRGTGAVRATSAQ
jgi:carboxypeptidase C (cathepsin A)